jgi:DNA gyrase subunit A
VVTDRGLGKRSRIADYRLQGRGGKGVINIRTTPKTGKVVSIKGVHPQDELVMITRNGVVNRQPVAQIRVIGRNTQGVRLIALDADDRWWTWPGSSTTRPTATWTLDADGLPEGLATEQPAGAELEPEAGE